MVKAYKSFLMVISIKEIIKMENPQDLGNIFGKTEVILKENFKTA